MLVFNDSKQTLVNLLEIRYDCIFINHNGIQHVIGEDYRFEISRDSTNYYIKQFDIIENHVSSEEGSTFPLNKEILSTYTLPIVSESPLSELLSELNNDVNYSLLTTDNLIRIKYRHYNNQGNNALKLGRVVSDVYQYNEGNINFVMLPYNDYPYINMDMDMDMNADTMRQPANLVLTGVVLREQGGSDNHLTAVMGIYNNDVLTLEELQFDDFNFVRDPKYQTALNIIKKNRIPTTEEKLTIYQSILKSEVIRLLRN